MAGRKGEKLWRDALRIAVNDEDHHGRKKLRAIAEKTVELALEGDMAAIKEIGDRMDGKAPQGVVIGGDSDNPVRHEHGGTAKLESFLDAIASRASGDTSAE